MNKQPLFAILFLFATPFFSCDNISTLQPQDDTSPAQIMQADRDFSTMTKEKGMKKAFMHYMAKEGVLLRPDNTPIVGADAVEYMSQINDSAYSVEWKPLKADISDDGQIGYSYGIYEISVRDTIIKGTYVNVWKKQNGEWRFVLNSGNQGIVPEDD